MDHIAIQLRALQFLAHRAHNVVKGPTFMQDHEFLGELYPAYEGEYDDVVERVIGLGTEQLNISKVNQEAARISAVYEKSTDPDVFFRVLLQGEKDLCALIKKAVPSATDGTQNLLQGIADSSEKRIFKLKQRLA